MMDWLDPKWHGSVEEMLAFGRACAATKNWQADITLVAVDAHGRAAFQHGKRSRSAKVFPASRKSATRSRRSARTT